MKLKSRNETHKRFISLINAQLKSIADRDTDAIFVMEGICATAEAFLMSEGVYNGFTYLDESVEDSDHLPGIRNNVSLDERSPETQFANTNPFRRVYL
jgi:hypothetical protein